MPVRPFAPLAVLVVVACTSDNALVPGLDPRGGTTEVDAPPLVTTPPADPELASLTGKVCAPDGDTTVAHAEVTVHHFQDSTAETNGLGTFQLFDLPPGTWDVTIVKGSFEAHRTVELVAGEVTRLTVDDCAPLEQGETEIAVVTGDYDDIGALLSELHFDYDVVNGRTGTALRDFLSDERELAKYDVIFFNCGITNNWMQDESEIAGNLRRYVRAGGSVYASDWAYWLVEAGWPAEHDFAGTEAGFNGSLVGAAQRVQAEVRDEAMAEALGGDRAELNYDLDGWAAMEAAPGAEILIRGEYQWYRGFSRQTASGPLATRLYDGEGEVLYTSFHNEQQTTGDMLVLLQEIILSL
jgi:hypothetical protein